MDCGEEECGALGWWAYEMNGGRKEVTEGYLGQHAPSSSFFPSGIGSWDGLRRMLVV